MVRKNLSGQKLLYRRMVNGFSAACLVLGAVLLGGCETDPFVDTHELNPGLIGIWSATFEGYTDKYIITAGSGSNIGTVSHPESNLTGTIEYVYNFNESSGSLIVKRADGKFTAVFFNDLSSTSVRLGDAFSPAPNYTADPAVGTLEEAKTKFGPANANTYGGADANKAAPQTKQP